MPNGFLPNGDSQLARWSTNFLATIRAQAGELDLTPQMIEEYAVLDAVFADAVVACDPAIRTRMAVAAKGAARTALRAKASHLARWITSDPAVTPAQRINLGLTVPAAATRRAAPTVAPVLFVTGVRGRVVSLLLNGATRGNRRAKLPGAAGAIVFRSRTEAMPESADDWCYAGLVSRTTLQLRIPPGGPAFDRVWLAAQWLSPTLESGPTCRAVQAYLQPAEASLQLGRAA